MKITVEYIEEVVTNEINVKDAKYIGDYVLRVFFTTNENRLVDFKPFIMNSVNPSIKKYTDENLFTSYKIKNGNLNWNDYDLIFPVIDLYENKIMKQPMADF